MRFLLAILLSLAFCLASPVPPTSLHSPSSALDILQYSHEQASAEFSIPCTGCALGSAVDDSLLFRFQALPSSDPSNLGFSINDFRFYYPWNEDSPSHLEHSITTFDSSHNVHTVTLSWTRCDPEPADGAIGHLVHFTVTTVDRQPRSNMDFSIGIAINEKTPHLTEIFTTSSDILRFSESDDTYTVTDMPDPVNVTGSTTFNIISEIEYLRHLETQAAELRTQIAASKAAITDRLRQNRNNVCLKHLIKECDGVVCAARVVAQRICDKMGVNLDPAFGYSKWETAGHQDAIALNLSSQKLDLLNSIGDTTFTTHQINEPLFLQSNGRTNPIIYVLSAFAGLLGLTSLFLLIKKRCASARTRAERAADREERRNKRAYRRAARRADMRKRMSDFVASLKCFRFPSSTKKEPRIEDYEEKRQLILQEAAFIEHADLDLAEKGGVMGDEISELRHAHEIVASLVHVDDPNSDHMRYAMVPNEPPPPFPFTPTTARSRAASSYTLPSYTSESLPDYTSRYSRDRSLSHGSRVGSLPSLTSDHGSSSAGFTPSTSEDSAVEVRWTPDASTRSENSGTSVVDFSTRPSEETLRIGRPCLDTTPGRW